MNNIKIIRLQSGEDIMAYFSEDESGQINLGHPMTLFFKRTVSNKLMMIITPWLPLELIKENNAVVFASDILTVVEPKDALVEYYKSIVIETEFEAYESSKEIEESLMQEASDVPETEDIDKYMDQEDYQDMDTDIDQEYYQPITVTKKQLLH